MRIYRKATEEDLFGKPTNATTNATTNKYVQKIKIRKNQREYGAKKYIKP